MNLIDVMVKDVIHHSGRSCPMVDLIKFHRRFLSNNIVIKNMTDLTNRPFS